MKSINGDKMDLTNFRKVGGIKVPTKYVQTENAVQLEEYSVSMKEESDGISQEKAREIALSVSRRK